MSGPGLNAQKWQDHVDGTPREIWIEARPERDYGSWFADSGPVETTHYVRGDIADEMLAALKEAVAEWDYPASDCDKHAIDAIRAAIAKAEGAS